MSIDKNKILNALKADIKAAEHLKCTKDALIDRWKKEYNGEPYGNEQKGKSEIVSRDIKKQSEWQHASIVDPFVSTDDVVECTPITYEDNLAAKQNKLLLNTQFCRKFDRFNFITKAAKVLDQEGTLVVQTGWDYEEKTVIEKVETIEIDDNGNEIIAIKEVENVVVIKNQPTAKICRNQDVYVDPTCQDDKENIQFVAYRYESDMSTLRKDGRYKNLDKVEKEHLRDYDYDPQDETHFEFSDKPRKKLIVYEYWGNYDINDDGIAEPIVCVWVGDTIIRLEDNPYPDKKVPFLFVPFSVIPFEIHGEPNAEFIGVNQKIKTAILRGIVDNMTQSNNGQVGVRKNALDRVNKVKFLKGQNFEYNGSPNDFWQGSYNQIPPSVFNIIGLMNNEIESITGIKSFSGGITGNSLGSTATGARGVLDATTTRRVNIVRNIAENLIKPMLRKWMSYNSEFLEEEEIVRITNDEFVPIRRDDLDGKIDINITIATAEDNAAKAQELSFLLQTVGPNEDPTVRRMLMSDMLELMRMPDKAKRLREYQPEPDPLQEKIKQLQYENLILENEKLKADIADKNARASENTVDAQLKLNKAKVEAAKARKLNSEADINDIRFIKEDEEYDHLQKVNLEELKHAQRMELEAQKHRANIEQMLEQALAGDTNIGILK